MSNKKIKCQPKTRIVLKPHRNVAVILLMFGIHLVKSII